jgi:hypothetical protein
VGGAFDFRYGLQSEGTVHHDPMLTCIALAVTFKQCITDASSMSHEPAGHVRKV